MNQKKLMKFSYFKFLKFKKETLIQGENKNKKWLLKAKENGNKTRWEIKNGGKASNSNFSPKILHP
jgi:hypothetical protein